MLAAGLFLESPFGDFTVNRHFPRVAVVGLDDDLTASVVQSMTSSAISSARLRMVARWSQHEPLRAFAGPRSLAIWCLERLLLYISAQVPFLVSVVLEVTGAPRSRRASFRSGRCHKLPSSCDHWIHVFAVQVFALEPLKGRLRSCKAWGLNGPAECPPDGPRAAAVQILSWPKTC